MRLDTTGWKKPTNQKETIKLHTVILNSFFSNFDADAKRKRKAKRIKPYRLPDISLPGFKAIRLNNEVVDKRRIDELQKRLQSIDVRAEQYVQQGRPGKAIKTLLRKKAINRELDRLRKGGES